MALFTQRRERTDDHDDDVGDFLTQQISPWAQIT